MCITPDRTFAVLNVEGADGVDGDDRKISVPVGRGRGKRCGLWW